MLCGNNLLYNRRYAVTERNTEQGASMTSRPKRSSKSRRSRHSGRPAAVSPPKKGKGSDVDDGLEEVAPDASEPFVVPEQGAFLTAFGLLETDLEKAGLAWAELSAIAQHHVSRRYELETTAHYIASRLRAHPNVHSVKSRVKNPSHLIEKIIRKRLTEPTRLLTRRTYTREISDLIGIRVLHLFKGDWLPIHAFITGSWDLAEKPTANVRKGDSDALIEDFIKAGCAINAHSMGYRSVHYLVKSQPSRRLHIAELQVRTIFEEGWSEIDHRIRYPYNLENPVLNEFLAVFNSLAGSADEMGTFIQTLKEQLELVETRRAAEATEHAHTVEQLKRQVDKLAIDAKEKKKLEARVNELEKRSAGTAQIRIGGDLTHLPSVDYLRTIGAASAIAPVFSTSTMTPLTNLGLSSGALTIRVCERCGSPIPFGAITSDKYCPTCRLLSTSTVIPTR